MKREIIVRQLRLFVVILFIFMGHFQGASGQVRSGASFLKILPGARLQGMGYNTTALIDETYAYYANPAATGFFRERQWTLTYTKWIADIYNISLNYARPVRTPWSDRTHVALGINYQGAREFDSSRGATPPASANDLLVAASLGSPLTAISKNLSLGANFKYLKSDLYNYSASSFIFDFGALIRSNRFHLRKSGLFQQGILSAGISITNMGSPLQFIRESTPLPQTIRSGVAFYAGSHTGLQFQISADYRSIKDEIGTMGLGTELSWRRRIAFRGGYNFNSNYLSKFSMGISIRLDDVQSSFNTLLAGRNNALGFDMVALESNDFFNDAYRVTITHIPIGPEKFYFATKPDEKYTTEDTVKLAWQMSKDPDLFDDAKFGYIVVQDSFKLADFIQKTEDKQIDFFKTPDETIAFNSHQIKAQRNNEKQLFCLNLQPLPAGDYYWATWAYDEDLHVRFAVNDKHKIRHFKVIEEKQPVPVPVDTLADLVMTKTVETEPIRMDINFKFNSAKLTYPAREQLNMLGIALKSDELLNQHLELGGHTDSRGSDAYNLALSQRRVDSAKRFLVRESGVSVSRLTAKGYGESRPLIPNAQTEAEHLKNRRVELKFSNLSDDSTKGETIPVVLHGNQFIYKVKIENIDTTTARNITVKDMLPDTLHPHNFNIHPEISHNQLIWQVDSLAGGDSLIYSFRVVAPNFVNTNPYKMTNLSRVSAANDTNLVNNVDSAAVFVIGSPDTVIHFSFDKTNIQNKEENTLLIWARYLEKSPNIQVCIQGHTDSKGSDAYNLKLSRKRAKSAKDFIVNWIVQNSDISADKLHIGTIGYGERKPVASNETEEGRQKNRRIVIRLRPCK